MAAAAACPTAMPAVLAGLSGIAASEFARGSIQADRAGGEVILEHLMGSGDRRRFREALAAR